MQESCYYSTCTTPVFTVFGNMLYDMSQRRDIMSETDKKEIADWLSKQKKIRPLSPLPDENTRRDNLIIIICESLESWVLEKRIDSKEITPYLNSLISDSTTLYAPNMVTQVGNGRSIDCQLLLNAGMLPMQQSVYSMKHPDNVYYTINQALKEKNGAYSYLLTCDKPITWNQAAIARSFKIDKTLDKNSWHNDEMIGHPAKLSDGSFMRQIVEKLKSDEIRMTGENVFIEIITYSGHNPFKLPERLKQIYFDEKYPERMRDYMTMAHYTDSALSHLITYFKSRPDYSRTMIVITGDHEGLAGSRTELLSHKQAQGIISDKPITPFIVLNSPVAGRYNKIMGQIDMYPTILQLMHLDGYRWHGMGQSILDAHKPEIAIVSMTSEIIGDTATVSPEIMNHLLKARSISDKIISFDYFKSQPLQ